MAILGRLIGGRYRLQAVIGRGGMSTVYRAFDTVLERTVAVKLMHSAVSTDSAQLERFRREARLVAQLNHPNVVTVIDAGEEPPGEGETGSTASPYIVFECVEGETLKELIRREGPLEIPEAIAYAIELARALGAAHDHNLVHRDVKPQNILLSEEGAAKITDFGIARSVDGEAITVTGRVLATTDYIAPEQALGRPVTARADLYSLGVVLYEMLTGDVPFHGESAVAVAMRHVREELPDVHRIRPGVSAATAAVIDRAVAKDPADRYPDAAAMVADLEQALALETARAGQVGGAATTVLRTLPEEARRRVPWRLRHPSAWGVATAVLLVVLAGALYLAFGATHRGVGVGAAAGGPHPGLEAVDLSQTAAHPYNPFGTGPENPDEAENVIDGESGAGWTTEQYFDGTLRKPGGTGLGIFLDASPGVAARALEVDTPTPGFPAQVYVAGHVRELPYGDSTPLAARGWRGPVGESTAVRSGERIALHVGDTRYRYYLLWLRALPPCPRASTECASSGRSETATISQLTLFR